MRGIATFLAALLVTAGVATAQAQGLGDVASREREKREKQVRTPKDSAPVFTNADLDAGKPPEDKNKKKAADADASTEGAAVSYSVEPPPPPASEGDSAWAERVGGLRDQMSGAQAQVNGVEARISALNGKLNPMSTDYIYGAQGSNNTNEELQVREELRQAEAELLEARRALAEASEAWEGFRRESGRGTSEKPQ